MRKIASNYFNVWHVTARVIGIGDRFNSFNNNIFFWICTITLTRPTISKLTAAWKLATAVRVIAAGSLTCDNVN